MPKNCKLKICKVFWKSCENGIDFQTGVADLPDSLQKPGLVSPMFQEDFALHWFSNIQTQQLKVVRKQFFCWKINQSALVNDSCAGN